MKKIDQITSSFKSGSEVCIFCSTEDLLEVKNEVAFATKDGEGVQYGEFDKDEMIESGFISIYRNGVTLHISDNINQFIKAVQENEKS